jgi:hypothetical protein
MPATHAGGNLFPSGTPVAGGTTVAAGTPQTSAVVNNSAGYGATITAQVTNGGTGPTIPATVTVQVSADNTTFVVWAVDTAGVTASTTYSFGYQLPPEVAYARVVIGSNTAQSVSGVAQYNLISAL